VPHVEAVTGFVFSVPLLQGWPELRSVLLEGLSEIDPWLVSLACVSCLAVGGTATDAIPIAASAATLYHAGLIVDHVQDNDDIPTVGFDTPATATSLSTGLIFAAYHFLSHIQKPPGVINRVLALFSEITFNSSQGQYLGLVLDYEGLEAGGALEAYWRMVIAKSGSLLRMFTAGGAAVGTDSEALINVLGEFGACLGVMLQVLDDCRDMVDDSDSAKYEISLPLLLLSMTSANETGVSRLDKPPSRQSLIDSLYAANVPSVISDALLEWQRRALNSLAVLDRSEAVDVLEHIARQILTPDQH
jgi:geranylgeranyl pyrophosphate synthase